MSAFAVKYQLGMYLFMFAPFCGGVLGNYGISAASENDTGRDKGSKKHNLLICQELSRKSKGGI